MSNLVIMRQTPNRLRYSSPRRNHWQINLVYYASIHKHVMHALSVQHVILLPSVERYTGRASVWEVSLFMQGELHY